MVFGILVTKKSDEKSVVFNPKPSLKRLVLMSWNKQKKSQTILNISYFDCERENSLGKDVFIYTRLLCQLSYFSVSETTLGAKINAWIWPNKRLNKLWFWRQNIYIQNDCHVFDHKIPVVWSDWEKKHNFCFNRLLDYSPRLSTEYFSCF